MKLSIVDYGSGNLRSLQNALSYLGYDSQLGSSSTEILAADKILLPGVGAFGYAMSNICRLGLYRALADKRKAGIPILGICLGMQLLLSKSEEHGEHQGLGFISGKVQKLDCRLKVPHIGWNAITVKQPNLLTSELPESGFGYFVHSYVCVPENPESIIALTDYGGAFASIVCQGNV
ncbi:imidazole glycerol phosphate synthase subunit HisH, partial [bacterium]|nr:imidazole glycerol phosphate synthase subunit HisH [bacterium]